MIPVAEARLRILADVARPTPEETLPVARALGRVLSKSVSAPFDVPPADNSAVDGYAVRAADLAPGGRARLRVVADLPAGGVYEGGIDRREALRIMTGAPMPRGADTVVPQELAEGAGAWVEVSAVDPGSNVRERLRDQLLHAAASADVVLTSGGVSVGDYDLVKKVLGEIGRIDFWQVAMQPGRPLAAGRVAGTLFFGLPGNPVASVLCFHLFVRPALWKLGGRTRLDPECVTATAVETMRKKAGRREFKRGILRFTEGGYEVSTTGPQGSGILSSMVAANCLIILEETRGDVRVGERVLVEPF